MTFVFLVSTSCGLMSLGALIIETSINQLQSEKGDHIPKKYKTALDCSPNGDTWMKLAEYI